MFDTNLLIENDLELNDSQKDMIKNDFNLFPMFYYRIKTIHEKIDLENLNKNKKKRLKKLKEFYEKNNFSIDNYIFISKL